MLLPDVFYFICPKEMFVHKQSAEYNNWQKNKPYNTIQAKYHQVVFMKKIMKEIKTKIIARELHLAKHMSTFQMILGSEKVNDTTSTRSKKWIFDPKPNSDGYDSLLSHIPTVNKFTPSAVVKSVLYLKFYLKFHFKHRNTTYMYMRSLNIN